MVISYIAFERRRILTRTKVVGCIICSLLILFTACEKREAAPPVVNTHQGAEPGQVDACRLITSQEIEAIQGSHVKEVKSSTRADAGLRVSQCFYTAEEFSKSVSLMVTRRDSNQPTGRSAREVWEETFAKYGAEEKEIDGNKEKSDYATSGGERGQSQGEEKQTTSPKRIEGIGEEAFWANNPMGGTLYVLKKDAFVCVSVGGPDSEEAKLSKSKALAQKAFDRL